MTVTLYPERLDSFTEFIRLTNDRLSGASANWVLPMLKRTRDLPPDCRVLKVGADYRSFADDKERVGKLRDEQLIPALASQRPVALDFSGIHLTTQSFIHVLLAKPLRESMADMRMRLYFCSASPQVAAIIRWVISYVSDSIASDDDLNSAAIANPAATVHGDRPPDADTKDDPE